MPTADRTTIRAAFEALVDSLRTGVVASPPTAARPLRGVHVGTAGAEAHPRPFLAVVPGRARPVGASDGDKLIEVGLTFRLFVDAAEADAHGALLDAIGAVEDHLDGTIDTGLIEGADGFDDRTWTLEFPAGGAGVRVAGATAAHSFVVRVKRGQNRVP